MEAYVDISEIGQMKRVYRWDNTADEQKWHESVREIILQIHISSLWIEREGTKCASNLAQNDAWSHLRFSYKSGSARSSTRERRSPLANHAWTSIWFGMVVAKTACFKDRIDRISKFWYKAQNVVVIHGPRSAVTLALVLVPTVVKWLTWYNDLVFGEHAGILKCLESNTQNLFL